MNAIQTRGLTRRFGQQIAVDSLDLAVPAGSVFGFLGPNGAGKTTTVRMLCALIGPSAGSAEVLGHDIVGAAGRVRGAVGILTETPGLYDKLSALQNLIFFARLYDVTPAQARAQAERYLRLLELWPRRDSPVGGFSKGMRQKLAIARALLHDPQLIFLDEPTSGLDPAAARTVRDFIKELRSEGRTIFLTTHNLTEADELCDLVAVFRTRLLRLDSPANLRAALFGRGLRVRLAGPAEPYLGLLRGLPGVREVTAGPDEVTLRLDNPDAESPALVRALVGAGAPVRYVEPLDHSLEDVYLQLIEEAQ